MSNNSALTFAIADIHGEMEKLENLLDHCGAYAGSRERRFVFLGDYLDRGPDSRGVVELLSVAQFTFNDSVICLAGNHEEMLLDAADDRETVYLDGMPWGEYNGGDATLASYGVRHPREIARDHLDWLRFRPLLWQDKHRLFVHAGILPGLPIEHQPRESLLWVRGQFLMSDSVHGPLIVHGHTPTDDHLPDLRHNRLNLDTGACYGGPLVAAVFCDSVAQPLAYLFDDGRCETLLEEPEETDPATEIPLDVSVSAGNNNPPGEATKEASSERN